MNRHSFTMGDLVRVSAARNSRVRFWTLFALTKRYSIWLVREDRLR